MQIYRSLVAVMALLTSGLAMAQIRSPVTGGGSTGGVGGNPPVSSPPLTSSPNTTSPNNGQTSPTDTGLTRPLYFSGRVMLDDGNPAPLNIQIRRSCSGNPRTVAYTDGKGRFSFQWGDTSGIMPDASEMGGSGGRFGSTSASASSRMSNRGGLSPTTGCDLQAVAAGYRSDRVDLSGERYLDSGDVGTIVLHRLAEVEGRSISATSLAAPKDAAKAYEKGSQALEKNKPADAEKELGKAVELYPKYANAWYDLGRARLALKNADGARDAFVKATEADDKLVGPYLELGQLAVQGQKWDDTAKYLDRALALDPIDYPQLWYIDAVADFNTRHFDAAEHSAREAIKSDPEGKNPRIRELMGLLLDQKGDTAGALEAFREFLRLAPAGTDADKTRQRVGELEANSKTN
jgi:tetratricopeptide (TPR) repeat protein